MPKRKFDLHSEIKPLGVKPSKRRQIGLIYKRLEGHDMGEGLTMVDISDLDMQPSIAAGKKIKQKKGIRVLE